MRLGLHFIRPGDHGAVVLDQSKNPIAGRTQLVRSAFFLRVVSIDRPAASTPNHLRPLLSEPLCIPNSRVMHWFEAGRLAHRYTNWTLLIAPVVRERLKMRGFVGTFDGG